MHQLGQLLYRDVSLDQLREDLKDQSVSIMGFPFGGGSQFVVLNTLYKSWILSRKLFYPGFREEDFSEVENAFFFIEDFPNPYMPDALSAVLGGLMITINGEKRYLFVDQMGNLVNISQQELVENYLTTSIRRLCIYY